MRTNGKDESIIPDLSGKRVAIVAMGNSHAEFTKSSASNGDSSIFADEYTIDQKDELGQQVLYEMVSKILRGLLLNLSNKKIINSKHNSNNIFIYNNRKIKKIKLDASKLKIKQ